MFLDTRSDTTTETRVNLRGQKAAMQQKRKAREDDEDDQDVIQLALELGSIFNKGFDIKLKVCTVNYWITSWLERTLTKLRPSSMQALDRLRSCIDHADPNYRNQRIMIESDVAHVLLELLQDESEAVAVKSASVIAAITDHCASSKVRLQSGVTALENQSCNILFNPVQDHFLDAIPVLVPWTLDFRLIKSDTANETLGNITSFNKTAKVVLIESLCSCIDKGNTDVIELLDRTLAVMDNWQDELVNVLAPRCTIIMECLKNKQFDGIIAMTNALGFISTVCEGAPDVRSSIVESNGMVTIMELLLMDDLLVKDAAVNTLWQMSSRGHEKKSIFEALRCIHDTMSADMVQQIARSLAFVVQAGERTQDNEADDLDSCQDSGGEQVDYDEEARKLEHIVKQFARSNAIGREGQSSCGAVEENTSCSIM